MLAHFGFKDGSGDWFLTINTDVCTGCSECMEVCPAHILEITNNEYDPLSENKVVIVKQEERNKLRYKCAPCRPNYGDNPPPCTLVCKSNAISHSESWRNMHGQ